MQTSSLSIRFPISVGSTTEIVVAPGKVVRVFLVDSLVPLYNVVYAGSRFMANREQVKRQIEALAAHGSEMPAPTWEWKLNAGFDRSVDGHAKKGWMLIEHQES
ncbi:hypothetical protein PXJ20_21405 [Paraburkholderia sp. A1RI_3L]|jgi:hypothetical protein|uniref:hypothetical protein n=1 Tax=Paraburkholderia TaxID=1822464 RepID=UPI0005AA0FA1|nr:hypothetical protein [Paraburkholderia kururiensis]